MLDRQDYDTATAGMGEGSGKVTITGMIDTERRHVATLHNENNDSAVASGGLSAQFSQMGASTRAS